MATIDVSNPLAIAKVVISEIATANSDVSVAERIVAGEFHVPAATHSLAKLLVDTKAELDALKVLEKPEELAP